MAKTLEEMTAAELAEELSMATVNCWNVRYGCSEEKKARILDRVDHAIAEVRRRLLAAERIERAVRGEDIHRRGTEDAEKSSHR